MPDSIEVDRSNKTRKRRIDSRDFDYVAEFVINEYEKRKRLRKDRERHWEEIDRQVSMEPERGYKTLPNGQIDSKKAWMSEMELPLQAQALEVLTADARRMMHPADDTWFRAHGEMTDDYLARADFKPLVLGDTAGVPVQLTQSDVDRLVEGFILHTLRQYDFYGRYDRVNAEAFKYGIGVARARMETKSGFIHESRGTRRVDRKMPVFVPVSIKQLYLDEPMPSMHSAHMLSEAHIAEDNVKLVSIALAANKGSSDPDDEDGGWMPQQVARLEADEDGYVKILEMEGDIVIPRRTVRSVVLPNVIVTVGLGASDSGPGGKATRSLIRLRYRKADFSSYILHPYHYECVDEAYPTSPLMKGRPVQIMAVHALNRLMDAAMLKNHPPIGYSRDDNEFAASGGPMIFPGAQWATMDTLKVHTEIGGEPAALAEVFSVAIRLYGELTGVLPARLGAQTNSHTTAFAKDAELTRGAARTVDYVQQTGQGPVTRWLHMCYQMARNALRANETVSYYIDSYGGFVEVGKNDLPERALFSWSGSSGAFEAQQRAQKRLMSLQMALQMDQVAQATGQPPTVDVPAAIREVLREGTWTDVDIITQGVSAATAPEPLAAQPAVLSAAPQ